MAEVYTVCLLAVVPLGLRLNLRQPLHHRVHDAFQNGRALCVVSYVFSEDAVCNVVVLKELFVIHLGHVHSVCPAGFSSGEVGLDDLHIGHNVDHFLFGEQTVRHKCFALVSASRKQEQNKNYEYETLHSESIAYIGKELDAHQSDFLLFVFVLAQLAERGLDVVGFGFLEIFEDVFLVVDVHVILDVIVDV